MSPGERMGALIQYKPIDRVPVIVMGAGYSVSWTNYSLKDFYYNPELAYDIQEKVIKVHGHDGSPSYGFQGPLAVDLGGELVFSEDRLILPILKSPICKTFEDVENLKMPDLTDKSNLPFTIQKDLEFNRILISKGQKISIMPAAFTERAASLVGLENFIKWFYKAPELVHRLQRLVTDYLLQVADLMIEEFGTENCNVFEPLPVESQNLISPKMFEKFCLPYIAEVNSKMIEKGVKGWIIHLCGKHTKNLHHWKAEIKVPSRSIISIGHEMDIEETAKYFGPDYIIAGNIETALLKTGTYNEIYNRSRGIVEKMKYNEGGFIFMPACSIAENTPPINVQAMINAGKEFGRF